MRLILGIEGYSLTSADVKRLNHACVAGVILFKRNYHDIAQLKRLTDEIRRLRTDLIISVDHEGGRVQRFQEGFTRLPSARKIVEKYRINPSAGLSVAEICGLVTAIELQQQGVDLSYAPVLDVDFGLSEVIGDRAFGSLTQEIIALAGAFMRGLHRGGMRAVGKHFPGHGGVIADTHGSIAVDERPLGYLWQADILPFRQLILQGLDAIMPAHVIYSSVDALPAGFSSYWLRDILRGQLGFQGIIISDDLDMAGADAVGDLSAKLKAAHYAGCDLTLLCNNFEAMEEALTLASTFDTDSNQISKLLGRFSREMPSALVDFLPACRAKIAKLFSSSPS